MDANSISAADLLRAAQREIQNRPGADRGAVESLNLQKGQQVEGKVVDLPRPGVASVNINGVVVTVPAGRGVAAGDAVTLRVVNLSPTVLFEILGGAGQAGVRGNASLAALLQSQGMSGQLWQNLLGSSGLGNLNSAAGIAGELSQLLDNLGQLSRGGGMPGQSGALSADLQQTMRAFNQSLENRILGTLQSLIAGDGSKLSPQALEQRILALLKGSPATLERLLGANADSLRGLLQNISNSSMNALHQLLGLGNAGAQSAPALINSAAEIINNSASTVMDTTMMERIRALLTQALSRLQETGRNISANDQQSLRSIFSNAQQSNTLGEIARAVYALRSFSGGQLAGAATPQAAAQPGTGQFAETVARDLEQALLQSREGERILLGNQLSRLLSSSNNAAERMETLQRLNAGNLDRGQPLLLAFPFKFDKEVTEVQIRHKSAGNRKKSGQPLTMVMMLNLQSLGQLRLDVLLQNKNLHCHVYVENDEIAALVDSLSPAFKEQVAGRGFKLTQFSCSAEKEKLNQADMVVNTFSGEDGDQGVVDVQI